MKKILPVIILLCLGISIMAQPKNSLPNIPGVIESITVSNQNKVELNRILSGNSIFALYAKRTLASKNQKANTLSTALLDSIVTKNASGTYTTKEAHSRDLNARDTLISEYTWNSTTSNWELNQKNQLAHDSRGNIISSTIYSIFAGYILGTSKYEATYDSNNHETVHIAYTWDMATSTWLADTKKETTYNASGKETVSMDYSWQSGTSTWTLTGKTEYTYDANGYLVQEIESKLNTGTSLLENDQKSVFSNDGSGRDTLATSYTWNKGTMVWDLSGKITITYNTNGEMASVISYQWKSDTSTWEGLFKATYSYNGSNLSTLILYTWNKNSSAWVEFTKTENLYDTNGNITVETSYMWNVNVWDKQSVANYYYSAAINTGVTDINSESIHIYPNPVIDMLHINSFTKAATVSIVDIIGKTVYKKQLVGDVIDVSNLKSGIYFLSVNTGIGRYTFKFVKE